MKTYQLPYGNLGVMLDIIRGRHEEFRNTSTAYCIFYTPEGRCAASIFRYTNVRGWDYDKDISRTPEHTFAQIVNVVRDCANGKRLSYLNRDRDYFKNINDVLIVDNRGLLFHERKITSIHHLNLDDPNIDENLTVVALSMS